MHIRTRPATGSWLANPTGYFGTTRGARVCLAIPLFVISLALATHKAAAQGCVAIRNNPNPSSVLIESDLQGVSLGANEWIGSLGFRWFQSNRVFSGDVEQPQLYGQMANQIYTFDVSATYGITARWSVSLDVPYSYGTRSTFYEHDRVTQHTMTARGIGDVRFTTDVWLLDPHEHMDGNISLGVGFTAPTGDANATDTAYRATGPVTRPVDVSIQPGTGGWGIIMEMQAYQKVYGNLFAYLNGSYIMTPQEQNDTEYTLADIPAVAAFLTPSQTHNSIPDQYLGRGGFSYIVWLEQGLTVSLGARIDGIPAYDAIGGSNGFRRSGYVVSIEPGLSWTYKQNSLSITAPVAVYRNRTQSAPEAELDRAPGFAAFADYSIQATFSHRF